MGIAIYQYHESMYEESSSKRANIQEPFRIDLATLQSQWSDAAGEAFSLGYPKNTYTAFSESLSAKLKEILSSWLEGRMNLNILRDQEIGERKDYSVLKKYSIVDRQTVEQFVSHHPLVLPYIEEVLKIIPDYFDKISGVSLEVSRDPEEPSYEQLFIVIRTNSPVDESIANLRRFEEDWLFPTMQNTGSLLNIDLG